MTLFHNILFYSIAQIYEMYNMKDLVTTTTIRIIIIDDNQIQYNKIIDLLHAENLQVTGVLLDDLLSFEKNIPKQWDLIFFSKAYDFDENKLFEYIQASGQPDLPCLRLDNQQTIQDHYQLSNGLFFDQVNLNHPQHFLEKCYKALQVSKLYQEKQILENSVKHTNNQFKNNTEQMQQASMVIEEGIVIETNQHFKKMFEIEDAFGLPLLDILRPKHVEQFKQQFKAINTQTSQTTFIGIESENSVLSDKFLNLKIFSDKETDGLHISISQPGLNQSTEQETLNHYQQINQIIQTTHTPLSQKILVSFDLDLTQTTAEITQIEHQTQHYIYETIQDIKKHFKGDIIQLSPFNWVGIAEIIPNTSFKDIEKQLSHIVKYPLYIGSTIFNDYLQSEEQFQMLYAKAKVTARSLSPNIRSATSATNTPSELKQQSKITPTLQIKEQPKPILEDIVQPAFEIKQPEAAPIIPEPALITEPHTELPQELQPITSQATEYQSTVKYQQIYDKHDINQHMFEVTTDITDPNGISYSLNNDSDLPDIDNAALIQIEQKTIQIACQTLKQFAQNTPDAAIIINVHHSLIQHQPFTSYLNKVIQNIQPLNFDKLTLQFNAPDIIAFNLQTHPLWQTLKNMKIAIGLRHFNFNTAKIALLEQIQPQICFMALNLSQILSSTTQHQYIQEQFNYFSNISFVIPELHDMNQFADAWNIDCRYLQGSYFQDQLLQMTNI